jgi:hypothetical protein
MDDWDKAASFLSNATPRRSTLSLGGVQVTGNVKTVFVTLRHGVAALLLIVVATLAVIYSKEIALLLALYRYEGGAIAFTSRPRTPHYVGSVRGASLPHDFQVLADNGNMRIAAAFVSKRML